MCEADGNREAVLTRWRYVRWWCVAFITFLQHYLSWYQFFFVLFPGSSYGACGPVFDIDDDCCDDNPRPCPFGTYLFKSSSKKSSTIYKCQLDLYLINPELRGYYGVMVTYWIFWICMFFPQCICSCVDCCGIVCDDDDDDCRCHNGRCRQPDILDHNVCCNCSSFWYHYVPGVVTGTHIIVSFFFAYAMNEGVHTFRDKALCSTSYCQSDMDRATDRLICNADELLVISNTILCLSTVFAFVGLFAQVRILYDPHAIQEYERVMRERRELAVLSAAQKQLPEARPALQAGEFASPVYLDDGGAGGAGGGVSSSVSVGLGLGRHSVSDEKEEKTPMPIASGMRSRVVWSATAFPGPEPDCALFCGDTGRFSLTAGRCTHFFCSTCLSSSLEAILEVGQFNDGAMCPGCRADAASAGAGGDAAAAAARGAGLIDAGVVTELVRAKALSKDVGTRFVKQQLTQSGQNLIECPNCAMVFFVAEGRFWKQLEREESKVNVFLGSRQRMCVACGVLKGQDMYSKTQWRKSSGARCLSCIRSKMRARPGMVSAVAAAEMEEEKKEKDAEDSAESNSDGEEGPLASDAPRQRAECVNCRFTFCLKCNIQWHKGVTCDEFRKQQAGIDQKTERLIALTTKPCPNCGFATSRYRGHACHHIMPGRGCPNCRRHWCFNCAGPWPCRNNCGLFCSDRCSCVQCPDCTRQRHCKDCDGPGQCRPTH